MKRIAVYCGSNKGTRPEYAAAAQELGTLLAREKIELVYGGGIARPGGYGTFEEFFEVLAWSQLGWHQKPFGLLDIAGFYRPLMAFLDHTRNEGFIRPQHRELVLVEAGAEKMLQRMKAFRPPNEVKWVR